MPPRATLSSLPRELKTRIVDLCYQRDQARLRAAETFSRRSPYDEPQDDYWYEEVDEAPSAVGALFQVSREWHEMATPYRFRRLTAEEVTDSVFQSVLRPKYGRFIKELLLEYDGADREALVAFLAGFDQDLDYFQLPWIEEMAVETRADSAILAPFITVRYIQDLLRPLARRAAHIDLGPYGNEHSIPICSGDRLQTLKLSLTGVPDGISQVIDLAERCPQLTKLTVSGIHESDAVVSLDHEQCSESRVTAPTRVRSLDVHTQGSSAGLRRLLDRFAVSLETMTITSYQAGPPAAILPLFESRQFAALRTLTVRCEVESTENLLFSVSSSTVPNLRSLEWHPQPRSLRDVVSLRDLATPTQRLLVGFAHHSAPIEINLTFYREPARLFEVAKSLPSHLTVPDPVTLRVSMCEPLSRRFASYFTAPAVLLGNNCDIQAFQQDVDKTLRSIRDMTDFAAATGDRTKLMRIAQALQECEWLRDDEAA